jgi:hypothetical protein
MRPVAFGEAVPAGTRLILFSDEKPDRFFTVIKFWMDSTSGAALELKTGVPTYQVEDGLPRRRLCGGGKKGECISSSSCQFTLRPANTAGVSGAPILPALIPGRSLRARC